MALPYTIANGQDPDGDKLQANFAYLAAGMGLNRGTLSELRVLAAAAPTAPFLCVVNDPGGPADNCLFVYTGDVTEGDGGFVQMGGW
jgi:hypothetical protein